MQSQSKRWWYKHTEWLPFGTPPQFYEDLRAMNNFKTDQARKNQKIPSIVGGTSFFALLVALMVVALTLISCLRLRCYHCMSSRYSSPLTEVCLVDFFFPPAVPKNAD